MDRMEFSKMGTSILLVLLNLCVGSLGLTCLSCNGETDPYCTITNVTSSSTVSCPGRCFMGATKLDNGNMVVKRMCMPTSTIHILSCSSSVASFFSGAGSENGYTECCDSSNNCNDDSFFTSVRTCFKCDGNKDSDCGKGDETKISSFKVCKGKCSKMTGKLGGISSINRDCEDTCVGGGISIGSITAKQSCCDTDLCNKAADMFTAYTLMALMVFHVIIYNMLI